MNKPKIELTELVKKERLEFTDSLLQLRLRKVSYQKPLKRKILMLRLSRQVCSMTKLVMLIVKRDWKILLERIMRMTEKEEKAKQKLQMMIKLMI